MSEQDTARRASKAARGLLLLLLLLLLVWWWCGVVVCGVAADLILSKALHGFEQERAAGVVVLAVGGDAEPG